MTEIISHSLAFPTAVFSVGLAIAVGYWLLVVIGAIDSDHHGGMDAGHAHGGDLHGGDLHVVDLHGGHAHGGELHDASHGHGDLHGGHGSHGGILEWLGFTGVPLMIPLSFLMLFGWGLSMLAVDLIPGMDASGLVGTLIRSATLFGAVVVGAPLAGLMTRPFQRAFSTTPAVRRHALVGRRCIVTTQSVTETFGQAEVTDYGAGHLVPVRSKTPNSLVKGSEAVVYEYDPSGEVFRIAPFQSDAGASGHVSSKGPAEESAPARTGESA